MPSSVPHAVVKKVVARGVASAVIYTCRDTAGVEISHRYVSYL